jgi:hypothetical protein
MKSFLFIPCLFLMTLCFSGVLFALPGVVKVGVINASHYQPYSKSNSKPYNVAMLLGKSYALDKGIKTQYKFFYYDVGSLSSFYTALKKLKAWRADFVIGPNSSNDFLLLKNHFKNMLIVSPYASSSAVGKLSKDYYSFVYPAKNAAETFATFCATKFPNQGVYSIVEADCKSCLDFSKYFADFFSKDKKKKIVTKYFIYDNAKNIDIKRLLSDYRDGDIILLPNRSLSSATLMAKITDYLGRPMVFLGSDFWGSWNKSEVGKIAAKSPYVGYYIVPWSLDNTANRDLKTYVKYFKDRYSSLPEDRLTFSVFVSFISVINAYVKYYSNEDLKNLKTREKILRAFILSNSVNKDQYRPKNYSIFKVTQGGEKFYRSVPVIR